MPKKKKIIQDKDKVSPDTGGSFKGKAAKGNRMRRAVANQKPFGTSARKSAPTGKAPTSLDAPRIPEPSDETVRLRAYFISERRRRFALPGDAESDWLEAKRQLLSDPDRQ